MKKYKMDYFGSSIGSKSGKFYSFDKNEVVEAQDGDFDKQFEHKEPKPKGRPEKVVE